MNIENLHRPSSYNISPEARGSLEAELPFEGDINLYLSRVIQTRGLEGEETILHAIGDAYHKHVYRKITAAASGLSDRFDFALSDIFFLPYMLHAKELLITYLTCNAYLIARSGNSLSERLAQARELAYPAGIGAFLTIAGTAAWWGLNFLRTPLERKMGLERMDFDVEKEADYVIGQLNQRENVSALNKEELIPLLFEAIDVFLVKYDGYPTSSSKRIKRSHFSEDYIRLGKSGWANPILQEVLMYDDRYQDAIAHEVFHVKGRPKESEAQLAGVIALVESNHPYLEYLGYRHWLYLIVNMISEKWMRDQPRTDVFDFVSYLREKGLNERTLEEIREREEFVRREMSQVAGLPLLFSRLENAIFSRMPVGIQEINRAINKSLGEKAPQLVYFLQHPSQIFDIAFADFIVKLSGGRDISNIYIRTPLRFLHSYRMQRLEGLNS